MFGNSRRELVEALVDLGRVHVARREVAHEEVAHRRQAATEPRLHVVLDRGAGARPDPDAARPPRRERAGVADPDQLTVLDVRVRLRVRVDVHVHRPCRRADRRPRSLVPRERQRRTGVVALLRVHRGQAGLRLDGQETPGVVLEVVRTQDHELVLVGARRDDLLAERSVLGAVLLAYVELTLLDPVAPRAAALDRAADLEARRVDRRDLVVVAEDGHRHRAVGLLAEVVLVEVDAIALGLQLEAHRGTLVGEVDLDQALALVRIDAALLGAGGCTTAECRPHRRTRPPATAAANPS